MSTERFANRAESKLNGSISPFNTNFSVLDGTVFPLLPQFHIIIDFEIMLVTAVSGNVFTVSRHQEGTSAANHQDGASVICILTKDALANFRADTNKSLTGIPNNSGDSQKGQVSFVDDGYSLWKDDGLLKRFGPLFPLSSYVPAANFGVIGQGAISESNEGVVLTTNNTINTLGLTRKSILIPANDWSITSFYLFSPNLVVNSNWAMGACIRDGASGKIITFGIDQSHTLRVTKWNDFTSIIGDYVTLDLSSTPWPLFFNIARVGFNKIFKFGFDPKIMRTLFTVSIVDNNTPNEIGFFVNGVGSIRMLSWVES